MKEKKICTACQGTGKIEVEVRACEVCGKIAGTREYGKRPGEKKFFHDSCYAMFNGKKFKTVTELYYDSFVISKQGEAGK